MLCWMYINSILFPCDGLCSTEVVYYDEMTFQILILFITASFSVTIVVNMRAKATMLDVIL